MAGAALSIDAVIGRGCLLRPTPVRARLCARRRSLSHLKLAAGPYGLYVESREGGLEGGSADGRVAALLLLGRFLRHAGGRAFAGWSGPSDRPASGQSDASPATTDTARSATTNQPLPEFDAERPCEPAEGLERRTLAASLDAAYLCLG